MIRQRVPQASTVRGARDVDPGRRSENRWRRLARWALDHPLIAVALVALITRLAVALGVALFSDGALFGDDERYLRMARQAADGQTASWDSYLHLLYERTGALLWPVTGLFAVFGSAAIVGQLYVVVLGSGTAVLTTKLALHLLGRDAALMAGAIVALLPSQILWSSIVMKDAVVWCLLVGTAVMFVASWNARGWRLLAFLLGILVMLVMLGFLRLHTLEIVLVALLAASVVAPARARAGRAVVAAAILLCLPLAFGMGLAGVSFVRDTGSLAERRALNADDANTAVVAPAAEVVAPAPSSPDAAPSSPDAAPSSPDAVAAPDADAASSSLNYLPKGLTVIVLRPYPWEGLRDATAGIRLAAAEAVLWYPILAFALLGVTTLGKRLRYMAFPLLVAAATVVMYALSEGNVGTAFRHRGEFVWVIALLAAMGIEKVARRRRARRRPIQGGG